MTQAIEVRGLSRRYGGPRGFEAVKGISFDVARGELFALLGTNGAGKTSTMELVEGLDRPSGGTVRLLGHDPFAERAAVRARIGVMLQDAGFPADLTVAETARMWAGTLPDARPVPEALELAGIGHRARVRVKQLSGGERRRLDLALAVLGRPDVLFLDEPTTGLDPESRQNTWRVIRDLLVAGTTVLLTTHYLDEAQALADRLAIMDAGSIVTSGTVAQVVGAYPARIIFRLGDPTDIPDLPGAPTIDRDGPDVVIKTDELQATLSALLRWADDHDVTLRDLDARSASLEEAFLTIAGGHR
ncbi:ABC transporter ATP-binding protein [Catenuloplanes atrovinosus]|uniref:ABC-2 type transport system ATP-binding protein n=1 Tax=Catenuloplanes atrovinosus TaxID=137266 RepID=A0AAE4C9B8_9ACTN|nr:ABC transporter ATP-binding protein [Catenuloplanes atrovinosus]MDR7274649.1 ABC-2 type transport system ATP-binding protein [Catenuloplanes atrovinosus]